MAVSSAQKLCGGFTVLLFATLAILCGLWGLFGCTTIKFPAGSGDGEIDAGLFKYRTKTFYYGDDTDTIYYSNTCVAYNVFSDNGFDYELDKKAEALQGLAIAVGAIGIFFAIVSCVIPCVAGCSTKFWQATGVMFLITGIMQGCTLLVLDSSICTNNPVIQILRDLATPEFDLLENPTECQKSTGYNLIITATVFWIVAGIMMFKFPAPSCYGDDDDIPDQAAVDDNAKSAGAEGTDKE